MKNFFSPKSVAIIGASDKKEKVGGIILNNLIDFGFEGEVYPINPNHQKINNHKCYPSVLDIEDSVDLAIIAIPAQLVLKVIEECAWRERPIKNIIIISAGFSESGEKGRKLEKKIEKLSKKYELKIMGPNCLGALSSNAKLNASFAKNNLKSGQVGLIMQSGAFTTALLDLAQDKNFGFSLISTLGNKMSLDETDFINYFSEDKNTKIIGLYLENIKRGKEFMQSVKKTVSSKPVLVLKAGNSKKTQSAILSHTGAMAGGSEVSQKAIQESGALYFENIFNYLAAIKFFSGYKLLGNKKIAIVTNAGGPGVITTDLIENNKDLDLFEFSNQQKERMKKILSPASSVENPVDVLGDANEDCYKKVLDEISKTKVGGVVAIVTPQAQTGIKEIAEVLIRANRKYDFPILPVIMGAEAVKIGNQELQEAGLINFDFPSEAINALQSAYLYDVYSKDENNEIKEFEKDVIRSKKGETIAGKVRRDKRGVFYYQESAELINLYGIDCLESVEINESINLDEDDWQFPLVVKIDSPEILHKNSKQGVALNIKDKKRLRATRDEFVKRFKDTKIIAQPQLESGLEIILGIKKDASFGPVVMCGLGGIMTEIFNEKELWLLPVDKNKIRTQLGSSRIARVFKKQNLDISLLVEEVYKLSILANENRWIKELDINPMIFYSNKDPMVVDVKVVAA
jgi:acetate---CoA ligase (ADP-forming)